MTKLLSIILASKRKQNLSQLFDNLEDTASNLDSFEVLVKVDHDNSEMIAYLETEKRQRPFSIRYIATPRLSGYWSLHVAYNELWEISSPETYFVLGINDETRFATRHWDDILGSYVGCFPDDVFHLRISERRHLKFKSLVECLCWGESYGFFTKKWASLTEGLAIGAAAWDAGQECVNFFLRTQCGHSRGIAVDTIKIANEEMATSAWHGLSKKERRHKLRRSYCLYAELLTGDRIENFYRLARKLHAYIWASENNLSQFEIEDDTLEKKILVKIRPQADLLKSFSYNIDFVTWLSILCDIEPVRAQLDWDRWPPVLAHQIKARRQLAELWLNTAPEQLENAYLNDLGKAHQKLLNISIRNKPLTTIEQFYVNESIECISAEHDELDESTFIENLLDHVLGGLDEKNSVQYLLAASLYCRSRELLSQGFDFTPIPRWLLDELSLSEVHKTGFEKTKQILKKFIPYPVRRAVRLILIKQQTLIEKILA